MANAINGNTDYAGFIDGYIAGNLAGNSTELHSHTDRIIHFLKELNLEFEKWDSSVEDKIEAAQIFSGLSLDTPVSKYMDIDSYLTLGAGISDLLTLFLRIKPELPSIANFNFKKIIYHYLNIARTTKDKTLVRQAKNIVDKFELSGS